MVDMQEVERLQFKMQRIRRHLDEDVDRLQADAAQLMDWKYYIRRHPLASMAVASVAGYFLVPSSSPSVENKVFLDPEVSREIAEQFEQRQGGEQFAAAQEAPKQGLMMTLGAVAVNALLKVGMNYVSQQLRETWKQEFQAPSRPRAGSPS